MRKLAELYGANVAKHAEKIWGCSSAGRAPALQAGGQEFDSPHLHQSVFCKAKNRDSVRSVRHASPKDCMRSTKSEACGYKSITGG